MKQYAIASVVDFGCGDWQFSRFVDWSGIDYLGLDIVTSVIAQNRIAYQSEKVRFDELQPPYTNLPAADLLIAKDVLQHWSDKAVAAFLPTLARFKYALITNCVNPYGRTVNFPIEDGGFRYLDLRLPPFDLAAREVYSFTDYRPILQRPFVRRRWLKKVLLIVP